MAQSHRQALIHAHLSALLFGGTALFAKLIELPAEAITFWRSVVAILGLLALCLLRRQSVRLEHGRDAWIQVGIGLVLGMHWMTYFWAIQLSSVAIGITALFVSPILTVLIEAGLRRSRPELVDLLLGVLVLVGVGLMTPDFEWENRYTQGILLGLLSACFLSLRNVLHTKCRVRTASGLVLLFYQLIGICLLTAWSGFQVSSGELSEQAVHLVVLGLVFTATPHFFVVSALKSLEAKTVLIISSLMVPYGIVSSYVILGETQDWITLLGAALVLLAATLENRRA